tara:strand:+ start:71 stop:370 length:300 start_codon:yes stop_codon:yes gene_type:complete
MLEKSQLSNIKNILSRLSKGSGVTVEERIFLQRMADQDSSVSNWLKRAKRMQQHANSDQIDSLLNELDLGSPDQDSIFRPDEDNLGEWFGGAPKWVARS